MSCDACELLKNKISVIQRENAALRHQLHRYAEELEKRQNTSWLVEELIRRCPRKEVNLAELVVYRPPEAVPDWQEITENGPLQRIHLEEITVRFLFNNFRK